MEQLFENYKASVNEESALTPEQSETLTALESITDQVHTDSEYVTYQRTCMTKLLHTQERLKRPALCSVSKMAMNLMSECLG